MSENEMAPAARKISGRSVLSNTYTQSDWKLKRSETMRTRRGNTIIGSRNEKETLMRKKRMTSVKTNETMRAERRRFMVLIPDTAKIFWVRKREYSPKPYTRVTAMRDRILAGTSE